MRDTDEVDKVGSRVLGSDFVAEDEVDRNVIAGIDADIDSAVLEEKFHTEVQTNGHSKRNPV